MITTNRPVSVAALLEGFCAIDGLAEIFVADISMDSRNISEQSLFIATARDAKQRDAHIQQAISAGATVVVLDSARPLVGELSAVLQQAKVSYVEVEKLSENVGPIAARFYGEPSQSMRVIAVTGTNGKTSVSQFIAQALESMQIATGVIGTLGCGRVDALTYNAMTTPDPVSVQKTLAEFKQQGLTHVVLEASSHALEQGRLNSVAIDVAVLTNISRDHLDYHGSMENYTAAKARLFAFESLSTAVVNADDVLGQAVLNSFSKTTIAYSSQQKDTTLTATDIDLSTDGMAFTVNYGQQSASLQLRLLGRFNVDNILASIAVLLACGINFEQAITAIGQCCAVSGRMQAMHQQNKPLVVIDFAHTPDALNQVLQTLRIHLSNNGQLWCVFGCGGDRDTGKRSLMGRIAEQQADWIVITDDNPRSEQPALIVADILSGLEQPESVKIEHDRKAAIEFAIHAASAADIVLVAGKGHENYQEIAGKSYPFSDADVVSQCLAVGGAQ
jgi:UDP-N-acetylmuramoyl-L-alanyl-D-glutamate--2,6-diaminopimelate ligase